MDPESSPPRLCELTYSCLDSGASFDISTLLRPPTPADSMLPSALLFLACLAFTVMRTLGRFGETAHRWVACLRELRTSTPEKPPRPRTMAAPKTESSEAAAHDA